ncbi:MAG: UDP-N-acetylmuramate--L-alanine ligase [Patescibacteria group bacterium]|nr:UDP-N-acetylmuramate--L-alanine ligase [Patescibacteria group bacterium]
MEKYKSIYFIGIGGIGLSALARYFLSKGWSVAGSDLSDSPIVRDLAKEGAIIHIGHSANNLKHLKNAIVVYSQAVKPSNPEMKQALKMGLEYKSYPQAVGELTKQFKTLAIAGAHGKSTTTAMLALILVEAGLDPTVIVGTKLKEFGGANFRLGKSEYLVLEADEYGGAFWNYFPFISGITNIDREHLDFYKNFSGVKKSFRRFFANHEAGAKIIFNGFNKPLEGIVSKAKDLRGYSISDIPGKIEGNIKQALKIPGKHNLLNAFIAYSVAKELGIAEKIILKSIGKFNGVWRRMEYKGNLKFPGLKNKVLLFDDYAHHPNEIKATLQGLREKYPDNALICVFQPHHTHRLKALFGDFKRAFSDADKVILFPVYKVAGREILPENNRYSSKSLAECIKRALYTWKTLKRAWIGLFLR